MYIQAFDVRDGNVCLKNVNLHLKTTNGRPQTLLEGINLSRPLQLSYYIVHASLYIYIYCTYYVTSEGFDRVRRLDVD